jgi:hypothetical protein
VLAGSGLAADAAREAAAASSAAAAEDITAWREAERRVRRLLLRGDFEEITNVATALRSNARVLGVPSLDALGKMIAVAAEARNAAEIQELSLRLLELLDTLQPSE